MRIWTRDNNIYLAVTFIKKTMTLAVNFNLNLLPQTATGVYRFRLLLCTLRRRKRLQK